MKEISKKTKIIAVLIAIVILAGIIVIVKFGLNFDLKYQETQKIQINLEKEFETSDIKEITDEILQNQKAIIQKVEVYEDTVSIIAKNITEEQKTQIINKINEKYEKEISADNVQIKTIPHTRGRDIIKPYIKPFIIATVIIILYMAIRYYKLGSIKTAIQTALLLLITQGVLLSIIAITRIPIGKLTIPMVLIVYVISLIGITNFLEKCLEEKKKQEE